MPKFRSWKLQSHGSSTGFTKSCSDVLLLATSSPSSFEQFFLTLVFFVWSGQLTFYTSVLEPEILAAASAEASIPVCLFIIYTFCFFFFFVFCVCTILSSFRSLVPAPVSVTMERALYRPPGFRRREGFPGRLHLGRALTVGPQHPSPLLLQDNSTGAKVTSEVCLPWGPTVVLSLTEEILALSPARLMLVTQPNPQAHSKCSANLSSPS